MTKRLIALLLLLALALSLAACTVEKEPEVPPVQPGDNPPVQDSKFSTLNEYLSETRESEQRQSNFISGFSDTPVSADYSIRRSNGVIALFKGDKQVYDGYQCAAFNNGKHMFAVIYKQLNNADGTPQKADYKLITIDTENNTLSVLDERTCVFKEDIINFEQPIYSCDNAVVYDTTGGLTMMLLSTKEKVVIAPHTESFDLLEYRVNSNTEIIYGLLSTQYKDYYADRPKTADSSDYMAYELSLLPETPPIMDYYIFNALTGKTYSIGTCTRAGYAPLLKGFNDPALPAMLEKYHSERDADLKAMGK